MSFTSLQFLLFFLALVICYFAVPAKYRWIALLAGSIYFYVQAGAIFLPFLAGTALITWGAALLISGKNENRPWTRTTKISATQPGSDTSLWFAE